MTELIILSPYTLHRQAWKALLMNQPGIRVVEEVNGVSRMPQTVAPGPATILVDLPALQPDFVNELKRSVPHAGLLILVQSYEIAEVIALLQAGAIGFISRDASLGDLARAIIAAGRGEIVLPPEIAIQSLMALAQGQPIEQEIAAPLSERETEVLRLLAQGFTNKGIAQALILSIRTVEAHLRGIFAKLGVSSRTEAALWAVQHGYSAQIFK
ncbi:MAG: response regulator transcription factor [Chloroflexi bacterium]|nr:response regulator transcription factor [Chloroflexota bacterium]